MAAIVPVVLPEVLPGLAMASMASGAGGGAGLVHFTGAGNAIMRSGMLLGRGGIYATSLETAGYSGLSLTLRTGVPAANATAGFRIPATALSAFRRPLPIGPMTMWQKAFGTQFTAAGSLDLATGVFVRTGVNWNQAFIYGVDATLTGTVLGVGTSYALDE
jgi:hypothetical protein